MVRCAPPANKPTPGERDNCLPYVAAELELMPQVAVVVCLGAFAWDGACRLFGLRPKPKFGHGAEHPVAGRPTLLGSFHPSQQNTFTGKLTEPMLDAVFTRAARPGLDHGLKRRAPGGGPGARYVVCRALLLLARALVGLLGLALGLLGLLVGVPASVVASSASLAAPSASE